MTISDITSVCVCVDRCLHGNANTPRIWCCRDSSTSMDMNLPRNRNSASSLTSMTSLSSLLCWHRSLRFDSLTSLNLSHNSIAALHLTVADHVRLLFYRIMCLWDYSFLLGYACLYVVVNGAHLIINE